MIRYRLHLKLDEMPVFVKDLTLYTRINAFRPEIDRYLRRQKPLGVPDKEKLIEKIDQKFAISAHGDDLLKDRVNLSGIRQE